MVYKIYMERQHKFCASSLIFFVSYSSCFVSISATRSANEWTTLAFSVLNGSLPTMAQTTLLYPVSFSCIFREISMFFFSLPLFHFPIVWRAREHCKWNQNENLWCLFVSFHFCFCSSVFFSFSFLETSEKPSNIPTRTRDGSFAFVLLGFESELPFIPHKSYGKKTIFFFCFHFSITTTKITWWMTLFQFKQSNKKEEEETTK